MVGEFIKTQILEMKWINTLISRLISLTGIDADGKIAGTISFFLIDLIKISILLCVLIFIISFIQSFFPPERSKKIMGKFGGFWARIIAALLGTITPFCSCSSIPIFMGFTAAGLPLGVTFSFLISSPMVDIGSLVILMSIFGWKIAVLYVLFGLIIAVAGGTLISHLHMEDQIADFIKNTQVAELPEMKITTKDRFNIAWSQVKSTFKRLIIYIIAGVLIGAIIHNWIPEEWVITTLGNKNPFGVIIATLCGVPMYADIFGCIPICEALLGKGALLGVVLSFMMAVTTLSLPSMVMLSKVIKPKLLGIFIAICTFGIIAVGYLFNFLQSIIL